MYIRRIGKRLFTCKSIPNRFWDAVQELKCVHSRDIAQKVQEIWNEYLGPG